MTGAVRTPPPAPSGTPSDARSAPSEGSIVEALLPVPHGSREVAGTYGRPFDLSFA